MEKHFVLMAGASNLTLALPIALGLVAGFLEGQKDIFVAHGPGRSYLKRAGLPLLRFEGISRCGLFDDLEKEVIKVSKPIIHALITDIGDDLAYNQKPEQIALCIEFLLRRLKNLGAEIAVTPLPETSIHRLTSGRYYLLRTFFNPFCHVSFREMMRNVSLLTESIAVLCTQYSAKLLYQDHSWYGFDRIHLLRSYRGIAYRNWLGELFGKSFTMKTDLRISSWTLLQRHFCSYQSLFLHQQNTRKGFIIGPEAKLWLY